MNILNYPSWMTKLAAVFIAVISMFNTFIDKPTIPYKTGFSLDEYELSWSDEFEGESLDFTKWDGHYFNNGDTIVRRGSYWNTDLATVREGNLHIATKYYPDGLNNNGKPGWYTCGIDTSRSFEQKYGYFEVRCILPKGSGQWSAFWMFCSGVTETGHDGEKGAEIDIYESPYYYESDKLERNSVASNIHINGYGEAHRSKKVCRAYVSANNPYEEFNTYGLEWNENEYIFYINGVESGRTDFGVSKVPEWLILSVEVGGEEGVPGEGWAGSPIDTEGNNLTDFIVDYVRVYSRK